jgi:hypothetical protein
MVLPKKKKLPETPKIKGVGRVSRSMSKTAEAMLDLAAGGEMLISS